MDGALSGGSPFVVEVEPSDFSDLGDFSGFDVLDSTPLCPLIHHQLVPRGEYLKPH